MMRWMVGFLLVCGWGCIVNTDEQRRKHDSYLNGGDSEQDTSQDTQDTEQDTAPDTQDTEQDPCDSSLATQDPAAGMVSIPAGTFWMGSPRSEEGRDGDEDQHEVTLTRSFTLSATEVTQGQFEAVMGYIESYFQGCENNPVEKVTWHEAAAFTNALSDAASLTRCYSCSGSGSSVTCTAPGDPYDCEGYRLPTEAEWEYGARAGQGTLYSGLDEIDDVAWYSGNSESTTHPAGGKDANAWGLYDMSGNVWEWVNDRYGDYTGGETDPVGATSGSDRVYRGGSWNDDARNARVANRYYYDPGNRRSNLGFRLSKSGS